MAAELSFQSAWHIKRGVVAETKRTGPVLAGLGGEDWREAFNTWRDAELGTSTQHTSRGTADAERHARLARRAGQHHADWQFAIQGEGPDLNTLTLEIFTAFA